MKIECATLSVLFFLASCTTALPGEDSQGKYLTGKSKPILEALIRYNEDHGYFPTAPEELVPQYIKSFPSEPDISFDDYSGYVRFRYMPAPSTSTQIECHAKFGERAFTCGNYVKS